MARKIDVSVMIIGFLDINWSCSSIGVFWL